MAECLGRVSGSRRLRGDLARKMAEGSDHRLRRASAFCTNHPYAWRSNAIFQVSDKVNNWSIGDVYQTLGSPETKSVVPHNGSPSGRSSGSHADYCPYRFLSRLSPSLLKDHILLIDFGQSFSADHQPPHIVPATPLYYLSRSLACTIDPGGTTTLR
jgi:serine/threonine-protein kinase SRPK3